MEGGRRFLDTGFARSKAGQLQNSRGQIEQIIRDIADLIDNVFWQGEDANKFRQQWNAFAPSVVKGLGSLNDAATELRDRAQRQESASGSGIIGRA